jgi:hypothetical protein
MPVITDGLVFYLDAGFAESYPKGGTTWYDLSGNGYNGTLTNGPTFNSANGGGIFFDGSNDYVGTTFNGITGTNSRTIAVWFYPTISQNKEILGYGLQAYKQMWDVLLYNGNVGIHLYNSGAEAPISYTVGTWQLATFTYTHPTITSYMNGTIGTTATHNDINTGIGTVKVGTGSYTAAYNYFYGNIGNVSIYNRALSSTEITQNYDATKGRFGL